MNILLPYARTIVHTGLASTASPIIESVRKSNQEVYDPWGNGTTPCPKYTSGESVIRTIRSELSERVLKRLLGEAE